MTTKHYRSWGFAKAPAQTAATPSWTSDIPDLFANTAAHPGTDAAAHPATNAAANKQTHLAYGSGRSYGDSCLNSDGSLIDVSALNKFIEFDIETGLLTVEPGVTLATVLEVIVPEGWFLPVTPGTSYVTVGGAVANDVHGKNHHSDGTFGCHVKALTLHRSNGDVFICTEDENTELFNATIGGLGLTGVITSVTFQLMPIDSTNMDITYHLFNGITEFLALSLKYNERSQYTVAWLDCASTGDQFARGVFMAADHSSDEVFKKVSLKPLLSVPFSMPRWFLNKQSIKAFNHLYYTTHVKYDGKTITQPMKQFFYPLDAIGQWNKIYGSKGFHQYQFVVPKSALAEFEAMLKRIVDSGMGSFLVVLKEFGKIESPGLLSFPREGLCLALDFADRGKDTTDLIQALDDVVRSVGGAAYPAKDRLMTAESFQRYFPNYEEFSQHIDAGFSSDFWRRVMPTDTNS